MKAIATALITTLAASLTMSAALAAETAPAAKADTAAGQATYTATCAACHSTDGNSTIAENPKLAGQHAAYIRKQLEEFKSGKRANPVMSGMAAPLSPADINNVAAWLAQQKPKAGFAKNKDTVFLGERIYRGGIADRSVPACAGCHSPTGAGIPNQFARLSGQQAAYTEAQLKAFRDGVRNNSSVMTGVAAKMNDKEIKAVADYIAGLH